jgi:hypothetical protein
MSKGHHVSFGSSHAVQPLSPIAHSDGAPPSSPTTKEVALHQQVRRGPGPAVGGG